MAFRIILIENQVTMKLKLSNLVITKNGEDIWIPLSDISIIILDNLMTSLTTRILVQLAEEGIGLVICDQKHLPVGHFGAYDNHSRSTKVLGYQILQDSYFYECFWKEIVVAKIVNQAKAYIKLLQNEECYKKIIAFVEDVEEGDLTNREAHAAKVYFNSLMGTTFSRGNESILLNSGLDYGYAIIRSYIARCCVGYGLNTQIGIHHKNEYNRFNLVDDLMEPIRPFVDIVAYRLLKEETYFKPEHRRRLVSILNMKILYRKKKMYLCNMLENYIEQVASYIQGKSCRVVFPDIDYFIEECEDEI